MINGTINSTFTYDPNGNRTAGNGITTTYTSFNQPAAITAGANSLSFTYDMDHQRVLRINGGIPTLYLDVFGVHAEVLFSSTVTYYDYISAGGALVAMRAQNGSTVTTRRRKVRKRSDHGGFWVPL